MNLNLYKQLFSEILLKNENLKLVKISAVIDTCIDIDEKSLVFTTDQKDLDLIDKWNLFVKEGVSSCVVLGIDDGIYLESGYEILKILYNMRIEYIPVELKEQRSYDLVELLDYELTAREIILNW